jgi:ATP-dependent DNA helicase RecQ
MDCADWKWSGEDERRLLYVAMTRARETLTVMRAEGGRNPYLVDLGTVAGVVDLLPTQRPDVRAGDRPSTTCPWGRPMSTLVLQAATAPATRLHQRIAGLVTRGRQSS